MKNSTLIFVTIFLLSAQTNKAYVAATVYTLVVEARKRQAALALLEKEEKKQEDTTLQATTEPTAQEVVTDFSEFQSRIA